MGVKLIIQSLMKKNKSIKLVAVKKIPLLSHWRDLIFDFLEVPFIEE